MGKQEMVAWQPSDDIKIMELHQSLGPRWSRISTAFPGRTVSSIRNRYLRLHAGEKLRDAGQITKNRCQLCGKPKRGHICEVKLAAAKPLQPQQPQQPQAPSPVHHPVATATLASPLALPPHMLLDGRMVTLPTPSPLMRPPSALAGSFAKASTSGDDDSMEEEDAEEGGAADADEVNAVAAVQIARTDQSLLSAVDAMLNQEESHEVAASLRHEFAPAPTATAPSLAVSIAMAGIEQYEREGPATPAAA